MPGEAAEFTVTRWHGRFRPGALAAADNGLVPELTRDVERMRQAAAAARRRNAVNALQIAEATCRYAASQLNGNGLSPVEKRAAALEAAFELAATAELLRRAVRLNPEERRALARRLVNRGHMSARQAAARLGVSERTVWSYLGHP